MESIVGISNGAGQILRKLLKQIIACN